MFPHFAIEEMKAKEEFYRKRREQEHAKHALSAAAAAAATTNNGGNNTINNSCNDNSSGELQQQQSTSQSFDLSDSEEDDPAALAASFSSSSLRDGTDMYHKPPTAYRLLHGHYDDTVTFRLAAPISGTANNTVAKGPVFVIGKNNSEGGNSKSEGGESSGNNNSNNNVSEEEEKEEPLPQISQFYVRTTGRVTVHQLQKLIFTEIVEQQQKQQQQQQHQNTQNDAMDVEKEGEDMKREYAVRKPEEIVIRLNGKGKPLCQDNTLNFLYDTHRIDPHTQVPIFTYTKRRRRNSSKKTTKKPKLTSEKA